ncbi:MAG: hypothetical protein KGJ07_07765 [Patescibacteria group bacterium]|nr:hypothetical protein [Patescibacteria group bacterium]
MSNIAAIVIILSLFALSARCDESVLSVAYTQCSEAFSIYNNQNCEYFSTFIANIDVIGGGSFVQEIDFVGNPVERTLDITNNDIGAIDCPEGVGCTNLVPPITVSFVRSPIPQSQYNVIPNSQISFALAYSLTQDTSVTKSGLPYVYQIYAADPGAGNTNCGSYSTTTDIPILSSLSNIQAVQADCGTGPLNAIDFRGTCGAGFLSPYPTGWLSDNDANPLQQCYEICCGGSNSTSIRVRQLGPYCYLYKVNPVPIAVVDFIIEINSPATGPISIPIYGSVSLQTPIVIPEYGLRVTLKSSVKIPPTAIQNKIQNGWVVVCGEDPNSALPNEISPVQNINNISWFYQPSDYGPYYYDATNGKGNVMPVNTNDPHTEYYGESGNDVLNLAFNYMKNIPTMTVSECLSLVDLIPNVPGYDTDNPITSASPYNLPSYCNMWNEAKNGNLGFLPPSSVIPDGVNIDYFNWMIRKNIPTIDNLNNTNSGAYMIYFPTSDQIADYRDQLTNALQVQIDFAVGNNNNYVTSYGDVNLPIQIVQPDSTRPNNVNGQPLTPPNCLFTGKEHAPGASNTGGGQLVVQLESTVYNNQIQSSNIGSDVSDIYVTVTCNAVPKSGNNQQTPTINIFGSNTIQLASLGYGDISYPLFFNLSATFKNSYVSEIIDGAVIATCSVNVTYNAQNPTKGSFVQNNIRCMAQMNYQYSQKNLSPCPWWNLNCQDPLYASWFFWIVIGVGLILIGLSIFISVRLVQDNKNFQKKQAKETKVFIKEQKLKGLQLDEQREEIEE